MRPWGPPRPPPPPNARRPAPGPNDQEDLQDQEGVRRRLTEAPTIRSTAGTAPRGRGNFYHANQRGNQNSSYPSYRKSAYERPNAEHTPSGHSGWEPRGSGAIDSLERETYSHSERPSDAANTGAYYHPTPSTPPRTHSSYTTSPSQGQRQHSTSSSDYNRSPWSRGVSNNYAPHAGSYPHQQFEPHSSTLAASSNYNPTSYQNKPTTPFSGKKRSYPPPSDQSAEAPPAKKPKPSSAMTSNKQDAGTISLLLPNRCLSGGKFSKEEIESNLKLWTEERLQPLIDGGKTIIRTYVEGRKLFIEWSLPQTLATPTSSTLGYRLPRYIDDQYDLGQDRIRIPLPEHTRFGAADARKTWIEGQLEYLREREDARPIIDHCTVNNGAVLVVEFEPDVATPPRPNSPMLHSNELLSSHEESHPPSPITAPSAVSSPPRVPGSGSTMTTDPRRRTSLPNIGSSSTIPSVAPESTESEITTTTSPDLLSPLPQTASQQPPSSLTGSNMSPTNHGVGEDPPPDTEAVVERTVRDNEDINSDPIHASRTVEPSDPPESQTTRTSPSSRTPSRSHSIPSTSTPPATSSSSFSKFAKTPTTSHSFHPSGPSPSTSKPRPPGSSSSTKDRDIGDIFRHVRPTNHQQVALPLRKGARSATVKRGISPRVLVSSRYVVSCGRDEQVDFLSRIPPRAPLRSKQISPEGFGTVTGMSMTHTPFNDQAIIVSTGPAVQISLLDFRAEQFSPQHYTFEELPHRAGSDLRVTTLPSSAPTDVGLRFITADNSGQIFRWAYSGEKMEIEEIMPPVGSMGRGVNDLFWATERSTAWLGINAHGDRGGFVEEWDVAQAKAQALGSVQLCGNALTVHQFSPNVVLAEVEDLDMQFVLHDWRTPRATQRFGYDSSFDSIAHLRGDVRGNLFARGDTNGNVRIWDIRNLDGYQSISLSPGDCITQVVFDPFAEGPDRLISLLDQNEVIFTTLLHT